MQKFFRTCKSKVVLSFLITIMMVFSLSTQFVFASDVLHENTVDILMFNDFHGNLAEDVRETGKNIGMSKMVSYVKDAINKNPNTIVVSGGDNYQGTAMSNITYGAPVSAMMRAMNVEASAVGNHEFDWGVSYMEKWAKDGGFDFVAANIYDTKTNKPVAWAKPYKIVEKGGIKVAFLGLAHPNTTTLTKRENVTGLEFKDPVKTAQEWVKYLKDGKAKEGIPDVIIALTHIDSYQDRNTNMITGNAVDLAKVEGIDAIISAHSHKSVVGRVSGKPIIQAYKYGRAMGIMSIQLDENNKIKNIEPRLDDVAKIKNNIIPDEESVKVYKEYEKKLEPILDEVIGEAAGEFTHDTSTSVSILGRWACEVMQKKTGAEIAIQNGGGLRRTLYKGDITMGDMYEIMPFDNALITMDLKGCDLKKAIDHGILNPEVVDGQFTGLNVEYDKDAEFENRITKITLTDGTPIDMNKYYKVVVPDFIYTGGDKYDFSNTKNVIETYIPVRDVLIEAIKENKVITPKPVDYIKAVEKTKEIEEVKENQKVVDIYIVKLNDVLWKIANKYNLTWQKVAEFNNVEDPNMILPGQKILIPAN